MTLVESFRPKPDVDIDELELYRHLAEEYRRDCLRLPARNHSVIARDVGARVFNVPVKKLLAKSRKDQDRHLAETRQKLMAFTRVVGHANRKPNSWKTIGHAFGRHHSTVIKAAHKYGERISYALND